MIVGVDVSSRRIDLAWLENGKPCRWHQELAKGHLIDRLRSIDIQWPRGSITIDYGEPHGTITSEASHGWDVTDVAIEYPFGRGNAIAALMATTGVITRQAPPWARVAWPSAGELRAAIGAKNNKAHAHATLCRVYQPAIPNAHELLADWDEHELDALVACLGWTAILEQQDAE